MYTVSFVHKSSHLYILLEIKHLSKSLHITVIQGWYSTLNNVTTDGHFFEST